MPKYANITNAKNKPFTGNIRRYYTVDGYTIRAGVPSDWMVQVDNRSTWYRVRSICFSNSGSLIVKVKGETLFVREDQNELRIIERGVVDPHAVREIELFIMNTSWTYFGLFHKIDDCLELAKLADSAYTTVDLLKSGKSSRHPDTPSASMTESISLLCSLTSKKNTSAKSLTGCQVRLAPPRLCSITHRAQH